ncbi:putative ribose-5-phosphate isomerase 2 [Castilleja foliolosa]|uniref:ribose-5-phosphate isomerase n=1 Tax=Castilleja foliolosa TaxID=1961234 RepID=A0ABD3EKE5_9LAMI
MEEEIGNLFSATSPGRMEEEIDNFTATKANKVAQPLVEDEVDPDLNLVKGRGGSLLREKMIESVSKKHIVIVDESKLVNYVGGSKLAMPVEVIPFCWNHSLNRLVSLFDYAGCVGELRKVAEKAYVTDNGNYIIDLYFEKDIGDLNEAGDAILRLPSVVG